MGDLGGGGGRDRCREKMEGGRERVRERKKEREREYIASSLYFPAKNGYPFTHEWNHWTMDYHTSDSRRCFIRCIS